MESNMTLILCNMTDNLDDLKNDRQGELNSDNVCRDFARGVCGRKFCKYKHELETHSLKFCHDYQNTSCPRPNCRFIHCTPEEVEEYRKSGEMSNQILAEATRKAQLPGTHPVCNQFRKGVCRRTACKYRHISKEEEEVEIMDLVQNNSNSRNTFEVPEFIIGNNMEGTQSKVVITTPAVGLPGWNGVQLEDPEMRPPPLKRRYIQANDLEYIDNNCSRRRPFFKGYFAGNPPLLSGVDPSFRTIMIEEENSLLHKEIEQLKRQVSDLTATNEFLLDQNATLRMSNKRNGSVTVPSVSITNTLPQNNSAPQPQQMIRTVTASVATVPVSIATVSTGTPVSANHVSIAGCPAVSIAPQQILAPSQQIIVTNPPTQLTIANSSQAQLAIAQQNLANNLAQSQQQLTSQAQQLALASTQQQLTSQAQHVASQQLVLATANQGQQITLTGTNQQIEQQLTNQAQQLANQQLTNQAQQLANQQLTSQAQQLALANTPQQLTVANVSQQLALASSQLTSQAQQLANQQLTSQAQQLALANTPQQFAMAANVSQQLALASTNQQLIAQQNLASEMHRNNQINAINTSQALSNANQPLVSYPIMTQSIMTHALTH